MGSPASAQALAQTEEGTPAVSQDSGTTRGTRQFTGSKLRLIGVRRTARGLVRRWEKPAQLHWVATARLKLGSPQPVRCRHVIACLLYWVRRA